MKFTLDYGRTGLAVEIPTDRVVGPLAIKQVPPLDDPEAAVAAAIEDPIGTPGLATLAQGRKDACILICDITRPVPNQTILRPMLKVLREAGIPRERHLDSGRDRSCTGPAPTPKSSKCSGPRSWRVIESKTTSAPGSTNTRSSARPPAGFPAGSTAVT